MCPSFSRLRLSRPLKSSTAQHQHSVQDYAGQLPSPSPYCPQIARFLYRRITVVITEVTYDLRFASFFEQVELEKCRLDDDVLLSSPVVNEFMANIIGGSPGSQLMRNNGASPFGGSRTTSANSVSPFFTDATSAKSATPFDNATVYLLRSVHDFSQS